MCRFEACQGHMVYYYDNMRHLVCKPYSKENLHKMAVELNIKRCWFHKNHYDIPKRRIEEIGKKATLISPREILAIIKGVDNGKEVNKG